MVVLNPLVASAWLGQMLNMMGEDQILWGTDSVWYGSPQWQIEALRRLEIPDHVVNRMGWHKRLGEPNGAVKQKILGLNAARLYNVDVATAINHIDSSKIEKMRLEHKKPRNNQYYGFIA
jgi:predicted TIM-barrel fold metal-dependent hydrolase